MSRASRLVLVAVGLGAVIVAAALVLLRRGGGEDAAADQNPTASVTVAQVRAETLQDVVTVYGLVQPDAAGAATVAAPRAVVVTAVPVKVGQAVSAGQGLIQIADAPATAMAYRQAADAATSAANDLARVQRLYDDHLAATDQLIAARKTLADAQAALAAQHAMDAGRPSQMLTAPADGVVTSVAVAPGEHVAQDAPLATLARQSAIGVKLGLEPPSGRFAAGDAVIIRPTGGGPAVASRLALVARVADPASKTFDAFAPAPGAALPIGSAVAADVVTGAHQGLAVPRGAVVFDETGAHVFVVAGGKAQRVFVTAGADHGDEIEISGPIAAGQSVAVQGAYELEDGMAVKVVR